MARGINKVILVGNLGQDPDVRYLPSGASVANISVATSENWKDKQTGELQERTEWHRIAIFGRLAEIARDYLRKGSKIYLEGSLRTRKWQAKDGTDRYTTEIIAQEFQMLDAKGTSNQDGQSYDNRPVQQQQEPMSQAVPSASAQTNAPAPAIEEAFDDEIPF